MCKREGISRGNQVFVFDENEVLVEMFQSDNIKISADYRLMTSFYRIGTFTFVAWGGSDLSTYDFTPFKKGGTKKNELLVALQRQSSEYTGKPTVIYWGEADPFTIEDRTGK